MAKKIILAGACRTAIGTMGGELSTVPAADLGAIVIKEALNRAGVAPEKVDQVYMGCVIQAGQGQNPARQASIKAGLPIEVPAVTINVVCGSGLQCVNMAAQMIEAGDADIVVAGGMENMSMAPYAMMKGRYGYRMGNAELVDTMIKDALWDAFNDYHMGITAENICEQWGLTREELDRFAAESQRKCEEAQKNGAFKDEIVPVEVKKKKETVMVDTDEGPRPGTTVEVLGKLRPAFKKDGMVTAGNSSGINDGAAAVVVMSEEKAKELGVKPMATWVAGALAGVEPRIMGIGPVAATRKVLEKTGMSIGDFDIIEANEAFAAQSVAVGKELGFDLSKLNPNGGAIALGHPVGASGCRILVTLLHEMEKKDAKMTAKENELDKLRAEVEDFHQRQLQELEKISGLTSEQAKEYLIKTVEDEVKHETAMLVKELESRAKEEADKKARDYVVTAIQKCAADHVAETTISVVQLPNDEMKGRIIGREGRNIRTLETLTGVDLIIDDTPEAVILSGFDPIRREVARIALEKLIVDGRIHPARIEEMVEKAQKEVEVMIREEGEAATLEVGVHGIHPELVKLLGKMKYRTSYGQNALKHSIEVAILSGLLAGEIGVDVRAAKRAGLLHDIGKSVDHEMEGTHVQIGVDLCRKYKESALIINAVEAHHGDVEPQSLIACIVQAADTISAARPGARRETLETYTNRLKQLEDIANSFKGVDKSFAIQAGREVRVMVVPEQISDDDMILLARDLSRKIESELEYPGQIKVNVIRESRVTDYAK